MIRESPYNTDLHSVSVHSDHIMRISGVSPFKHTAQGSDSISNYHGRKDSISVNRDLSRVAYQSTNFPKGSDDKHVEMLAIELSQVKSEHRLVDKTTTSHLNDGSKDSEGTKHNEQVTEEILTGQNLEIGGRILEKVMHMSGPMEEIEEVRISQELNPRTRFQSISTEEQVVIAEEKDEDMPNQPYS